MMSLNFYFTIAIAIFPSLIQAQECALQEPPSSVLCVGSQFKNPHYFGEWRHDSETGIGVIAISSDEIYIGESYIGKSERRGVLLKKWGYEYGLWSLGRLARTEVMPDDFIFNQLTYLGSKLTTPISAEQLSNILGINPLLPSHVRLNMPATENVTEDTTILKNQPATPEVRGDGSSDDATCQRYGFTLGTNEYAQCRMQIDLVRQQAAEQYRISQEQAAAARRAEGRALFFKGLGMIAGQPPQSSSGYQSNAPQAPNKRIYTLPNGRAMTCTTNGVFTNCY